MKVLFRKDMLYKLQVIARERYGKDYCDSRDMIIGDKSIINSPYYAVLSSIIDEAFHSIDARKDELDSDELIIIEAAGGKERVSMKEILGRLIALHPTHRMHLLANKVGRTLLSHGYALSFLSAPKEFEHHVFEKVKAMQKIRDGEEWWMTKEEEELANEQRASRISRDAWEEAALSYCSDKEFVTSEEVLRYIKPDISMHNNMDKSRVRGILQLNGWEYRQIRSGDDRGKRGFFKGDK